MTVAALIMLVVLALAVSALPFTGLSPSGAAVTFGALVAALSVPTYLLGAWQGLLVFVPLGAAIALGGLYIKDWR